MSFCATGVGMSSCGTGVSVSFTEHMWACLSVWQVRVCLSVSRGTYGMTSLRKLKRTQTFGLNCTRASPQLFHCAIRRWSDGSLTPKDLLMTERIISRLMFWVIISLNSRHWCTVRYQNIWLNVSRYKINMNYFQFFIRHQQGRSCSSLCKIFFHNNKFSIM